MADGGRRARPDPRRARGVDRPALHHEPQRQRHRDAGHLDAKNRIHDSIFRFRDEAEFTAFDDKFHKDRKIAAIYALLDDIVEAEKSDFKIFERRL